MVTIFPDVQLDRGRVLQPKEAQHLRPKRLWRLVFSGCQVPRRFCRLCPYVLDYDRAIDISNALARYQYHAL